MSQLKFVLDDELVKKFKQIVLAKHGKLNLTAEGEDAIRLCIQKYEPLIQARSSPEKDPLKKAIGAVKSRRRHDALEDLKKLEAEEEF